MCDTILKFTHNSKFYCPGPPQSDPTQTNSDTSNLTQAHQIDGQVQLDWLRLLVGLGQAQVEVIICRVELGLASNPALPAQVAPLHMSNQTQTLLFGVEDLHFECFSSSMSGTMMEFMHVAYASCAPDKIWGVHMSVQAEAYLVRAPTPPPNILSIRVGQIWLGTWATLFYHLFGLPIICFGTSVLNYE